tara:strand:+ start:26 stop:622 length:597 start_codon:yes stop_codon:yes gene_type:complete
MTRVVAITGGIGSGKTTLSKYLKKKGFLVHESDEVVASIYKRPNNSFKDFIKKNISIEALKKNKINKKHVANVIFSDKNKKNKLEKYIHNKVRISRENFIKKGLRSKKKIVFVDIPLLFEKKLEKSFHFIICILSSKKNRAKRVLKNKKFSKTTLNKIFNSQTSDKERRKKSQFIIYNNKTKKDFIFSFEKLLLEILA